MFKLNAWVKESGEVSRYIQDGLGSMLDIIGVLEELEIKSIEVLEIHIYKSI